MGPCLEVVDDGAIRGDGTATFVVLIVVTPMVLLTFGAISESTSISTSTSRPISVAPFKGAL